MEDINEKLKKATETGGDQSSTASGTGAKVRESKDKTTNMLCTLHCNIICLMADVPLSC